MEIKALEQDFTVCQVADYAQVNWAAEFCFTGETNEEFSLVCATVHSQATSIWVCPMQLMMPSL